MKPALMLFLAASTAPFAMADNPAVVTDAQPLDMRKQLLSEYHWIYHPPAAVQPPPSWATGPMAPDAGAGLSSDPNITKLAPFEVNGSYNWEELHEDFQRQETDAHTERSLSKLGIGYHQVQLGKLSFTTATIFFIPVSVSLGW